MMVYESTNFSFKNSGTYWLETLPEQGKNGELTPCLLDDEGNKLDGTATDLLSGISGSRYVMAVSPGVRNNDDGSFSISITDLNNNGCRFRISEQAEKKSLGAYGPVVLKSPLKECRATMSFEFYKSSNVEEFEISEANILGMGSNDEYVKLYPVIRQVKVSDPKASYSIEIVESSPSADKTDSDGNKLVCASSPLAIVPAIYAPKQVAAGIQKISESYLLEGSYLFLKCKLTYSGHDPINVELPLTMEWPEILPQNNYTYQVLVSSNYINLSVHIFGDSNDWEPGGTAGGEIGGQEDKITIDLGRWEIVKDENGNGWELIDIDNQVIGS